MLTAPSPSHPTTDILFVRPLSPTFTHTPPSSSLTRALRFSTHNGIASSDHWSAGALSTRTFSMGPNLRSSTKGKEREAFDSLDPGQFGSFAFDDTFPSLANRKSSLGSPLSRPSTADPSSTPSVPRRQRGSILGAASDALRFGRRRKSVKALPPPPQPRLLVSEVIEVRASAPTPPYDEDEEAEREQLRAAAVQSVGFNVGIGGSPDRGHVILGDEGDITDEGDHIPHVNVNQHENGRASMTAPPSSPPPLDNRPSDVTGSPQTVRQRTHTRSSSGGKTAHFAPTLAEVPAFPSTRAQIAPHEQLSATLPKHYPPPSLFMLALSKQWKARHVVLSAPAPAGASYLHVFKSSAADERELERLEINEHSVASVTDEDVGGRRGVVRVGGFDVGALRRELNSEDNGMAMMTLQIVDANESQNWINAIKNAVLGQRCAYILFRINVLIIIVLYCRSVRAGLGILTNSSGAPEPRGDLDVMLSMRMQGMLPSPTKPSFITPDDANRPRNGSSSEESSSPSVRSRPASPRSQNGVLSLKSLFSVSGSGSTRPRSPSLTRTTSPEAASGESFGSAASSLLSMRTVADSPLIKPYSMLPPTGPTLDPTNQIQRKIIDTQSNLDWTPLDSPFKSPDLTPPPRALSPSLNPPPPRRRAYTTNEPRLVPSPDTGRFVYNHGNASTAGSFGVHIPEHPHLERASSERGKPRAGSVSSTSTTTENGSARRWSRQSFMHPRLTPPPGSPQHPASAPLPQLSPWQNSYHQVPESERSASRCSSQSQKTLPSIISGLHVASKRASTSSSMYSVATTNSSPQHVSTFSISRGNHRVSIPPPPRPAPSTALPPTPTGSDTDIPTTVPIGAGKTVRRNSLARRALRLSLGQPAVSMQVQSHSAPHTIDGFDISRLRSHSRSTSVDGVPRSVVSHGYSIPQALLVPPSPPPTGPLPPPPVTPPSRTSTPVSTTSYPRASLKQRLRILSAPSGRSTSPSLISTVIPPVLPALEIPTSMPVTPIGERIAHIAPDADFLLLDGETPIATVPPRAMMIPDTDAPPPLPPLTLSTPQGPYEHVPPPPSDRSPQQMTVLSPPPRRGSARPLPSPSPEQERGASAAWNDDSDGDGALPPLDLACNVSTLSLSFVNGAV
ncbi:hypothetical protein EDB92DRAFT_1947677 [Lactarius akahatsu]|uniref:PH domain-containing protein n=1 Tax=Lactarius akahatsu TaxID=416441 RepID=A0AAD4Q708_9AGAM|nr:hypothetical protein EDB92DRAFT_1947677 [Lactarius akahatsu]